MTSSETQTLDTQDLEQRVKEMYREVAEEPFKEFHFETGRPLAERLGYPSDELDAIPAEAILLNAPGVVIVRQILLEPPQVEPHLGCVAHQILPPVPACARRRAPRACHADAAISGIGFAA